jgi:hypothetical protein
MSDIEACCTCATLLADTKVPYDTSSEKPVCLDRRLECCNRTICAICQYENPRFQTYCPFCQISSEPSALPVTGLRLPPSYASASRDVNGDSNPPPYSSLNLNPHTVSSPPPQTEDVLHFLHPTDDTLQSISLAYGIPLPILRAHNNLYSDSLLAARKWILIPKSHYSGPSLSTPPDPEEEERKNKLRRWMVATKCADYDVAKLYLKGTGYNLEAAVEAFWADEAWEKENPMKGKAPAGRARARGGMGLTGQIGR